MVHAGVEYEGSETSTRKRVSKAGSVRRQRGLLCVHKRAPTWHGLAHLTIDTELSGEGEE